MNYWVNYLLWFNTSLIKLDLQIFLEGATDMPLIRLSFKVAESKRVFFSINLKCQNRLGDIFKFLWPSKNYFNFIKQLHCLHKCNIW